jgi:GNAT superfamily N-acetyltransferase
MIRDATLADAEAIAPLIGELGYPATAEQVLARMAPLLAAHEPPLVWEENGALLGVLVWHVTPTLHRAGGVGRTVMLVVSEAARNRRIGRALVLQAEARCKARGCVMAEVTSNVKRVDAHRFYEGLGYEKTSFRLGKVL